MPAMGRGDLRLLMDEHLSDAGFDDQPDVGATRSHGVSRDVRALTITPVAAQRYQVRARPSSDREFKPYGP